MILTQILIYTIYNMLLPQ